MRHTAFGMFTAICGGAEVLSPLFLDVIPKYMGQGPYFGLGISALVTAIFSYYLPEPLNFHLPSTIEDTLYMQKSKTKCCPFMRGTRRI